jgi:hypothetical protein
MTITQADLQEIIKHTCPHCNAGIAVRQREDTKEWVHDRSVKSTGQFTHTICLANWLRNSELAKTLKA